MYRLLDLIQFVQITDESYLYFIVTVIIRLFFFARSLGTVAAETEASNNQIVNSHISQLISVFDANS